MKSLKRILLLFEILIVIGIIFSICLLLEQLYPDLIQSWFPCGKGFANSCMNITYIKFSLLFGIPLPAYALFFYILILFSLLVAEYAGEKYFIYCFAIVFPLIIIALVIDAGLAGIFIYGKYLNIFWIVSIIINLILLRLAFYWYNILKIKFAVNFKSIYKEIFSVEKGNSDKKAAFSLYVIFAFFLIISLYLGMLKAQGNKISALISEKNIKEFLVNFYRKDRKELNLPATPMVLGNKNAKIKIVVFTDFFCSACYKFYKAVQFLFSNYENDIYIQYYNFPLDGPCGDNDITEVRRSCIASRAFLTAALAGKMKDYFFKHYNNYKRLKKEYNRDVAVELFSKDNIKMNKFKRGMVSDKVDNLLKAHIDYADKHQISGVPFFYINGRELDGIPEIIYLNEIIKKELKNNK